MSEHDGNTTDPSVVVDDEQGIPSDSLITDPTQDILSLFLVQVVLILIIVRVLAKVLAKLRQPPVIGEILAGVILGPSIMGQIPGFESSLFPNSSLGTLQIFAQIGLIFFMFFLGLELDPALFVRHWRTATPIAVVSVLVPFALGCAISPQLYGVEYTAAGHSSFTLFIGTCLAFTAFPLLARILTAFRLLDTPFGEHVLSIAAIDDVLAWCTLALTLAHAGGGKDANGVYTALICIAYLLVLVFVTRPLLLWISRQLRFQQKVVGELNRDYVCVLILGLCASAIWTEIQGIHAFFGAFTFGLIVPKERQLDGENVVDILAPKIELLIVEFFLPLYFAYSGLRTNLASLNTGAVWGDAILVILVSTLGKIIPVTIMTRIMTRVRKVGDDFEQEDMDWEAEKKHIADTVGHKTEEPVKHAPADDLEMANFTKPNGHSPSSYSYRLNSPSSNGHASGDSEGGIPEPGSPSSGASDAASQTARSKCYSWRTCLSVGLLMNTTGLVTLVALNIGYDRHILGPKVFSMLVLMALTTTFMTSPFFHYLFYVPFIYERNIKREQRRKQRELAGLQSGADDAAVQATEEQIRARQLAEEAMAEEQSDAMSISSKMPRHKGASVNAPYSTNTVLHHVLNPNREIKIVTLLPPGQTLRSLTPEPPRGGHGHAHGGLERVSSEDHDGAHAASDDRSALRVSLSDGELSGHRRVESEGHANDVYSNKVD